MKNVLLKKNYTSSCVTFAKSFYVKPRQKELLPLVFTLDQ